MEYFKVEMIHLPRGLLHCKDNYESLIKYCYKNKLNLIKPIFRLEGKHNNKKFIACDLSKYFDLENITVNDEIFVLHDDDDNIDYTIKFKKGRNTCGYFPNDKKFCNLKNIKVNIPYSKNIISIGLNICKCLGDNYTCLHVRRGDKTNNKVVDIATKKKNIENVLNKYSTNTIYVMTNRVNELLELNKNELYKIYFNIDFEELKNIGSDDNYYLFCIEKIIMDNAMVKISTFKIPGNYYNASLTEIPSNH
tara:strand:- start:2982 stop:3731 length:750 start_codon:yes stop_codon:yes gene_type:complete